MQLLFLLLLLFNVLLAKASTLLLISNETLMDYPAAFGPQVSKYGKIGYLAEPKTDPTGCSLTTRPHMDWIALVQRGQCSFVTKVRKMQESGAIAVIVGDMERSEKVTMFAFGDTSDIDIPSLYLGKEEYNRLLHFDRLLDSPLMVVLQSDTLELDWPLKDLFFMVLVSPCVMTFFFYTFWRLRQKMQQKKELAPASVVSQLGIKIFSSEESEAMDGCAICLEDYQPGHELRLLPCKHHFHALCVDGWLITQKKLCPICKRDITLNV
ncbi:hypothetical protein BY458DRAFT_519884 [Sporodiniella umbellata]|nr:hypothetical protein BY458DRAFT_519884 [Sporodiniella umbellata]